MICFGLFLLFAAAVAALILALGGAVFFLWKKKEAILRAVCVLTAAEGAAPRPRKKEGDSLLLIMPDLFTVSKYECVKTQ